MFILAYVGVRESQVVPNRWTYEVTSLLNCYDREDLVPSCLQEIAANQYP